MPPRIPRGALLAGALAAPRDGLARSATLSVHSALTADDPMFRGLKAFKQGGESRTAGRVQVRLLPSSQPGPDEDVLEQARAGAGVAVLVDGGRIAPFVREFGILGAPCIANGFPELRRIASSPLFDRRAERLRGASGQQVLSFNWVQGERHLPTNRPVRAPADLSGLRLRTPGAPVPAMIGCMITRERVPQDAAAFLALLGMFLASTVITPRLTPILVPVITPPGIDPVHFGLVMMITVTLGSMTPPVGVAMSTVCGMLTCPMDEDTKEAQPFLGAVILPVVIMVFWPGLVVLLPNLMF